MQILINGKEAAIKKDSSFEFVIENRLFSGSDAFTLAIEFPLRGCRRNEEIFGNINRPEVLSGDYVFDCEIREKAFSRFGSLTITDITDTMVKAQFLEGRAEHNFNKSLDEMYVNEIDLGPFPTHDPSVVKPADAWRPQSHHNEFVALPWVNNESGLLHNHADYNSATNEYTWDKNITNLSWQPYLLFIAKKIAWAIGYIPDFSAWSEHPFLSNILICNTLPWAWKVDRVNRLLPHWTAPEFFEKLELFLRGEFDFDHRERTITFRFTADVLAKIEPVILEKVVDEYSAEINIDEPDCDYIETQNIAYKDADHALSKFYSCDWFIDATASSSILTYPDLKSMISANAGALTYDVKTGNHRGDGFGNYGKLFYVEDIDMYFFLRGAIDKDNKNYHYIFQPLNEFGKRIVNKASDNNTEIEFVPACIDYTEAKYGDCLFVDCGSFSESDGSESDLETPALPKTGLTQAIEKGKKENTPEYFSFISVGFYDGSFPRGLMPHPFVSPYVFFYNYQLSNPCYYHMQLDFSLRINGKSSRLWSTIYKIDPTRRYSFSFLSDKIPDARALFFINGCRYVCEKITATFTESGMSQLLKGEFFPLAHD